MDCPACGAPARPEGPDAAIDSSDGPLLLTLWQCARGHRWHTTTDAGPAGAAGAGWDLAEWLAGEVAVAVALARAGRPGRR